LVEGAASVFLNNDRAIEKAHSASNSARTATSITLTNGSTSATLNYADASSLELSAGDTKYNGTITLLVRAGQGSTTVAVTGLNTRAGTQTKLTTSSTFFVDSMFETAAGRFTATSMAPPARLFETGAQTYTGGSPIEGILYNKQSGTESRWRTGTQGAYSDLVIPAANYTLEVDAVVQISNINGTSATLSSAWNGTSGTYQFDSLGSVKDTVSPNEAAAAQKYSGTQVAFRTGTLYQTPFPGLKHGTGIGSTAKSQTLARTLEQSTGYGDGTADPVELVSTATNGFNLSAAQAEEVDVVSIRINYPGGFKAVNKSGKDKSTTIRYKFEIAIKQEDATDFDSYVTLREEVIHSGLFNNPQSFEHQITIEKFRPFSDFKIRISRIDAHDGAGYESKGKRNSNWTNITAAQVNGVTSFFKENLSHPFTAMGQVTFNSKDFEQVPQRTYHLKGLRIKVPSNYVTREEASNGVANYNRNVSTGVIESSYQDWDGNFRNEVVYTNNPAWIFYDILKNNRYGLGDFIDETEIDKFALFRIARYCDELVDDGKGGQEPRYTLNTYLTKETDAYKVLKDLTTNFLGMLYFLDGKIFTSLDAPTSPVYNFNKGNVIDGAFTYESTGSKTRANQVIVQWNNPDNNYALEPLIVEDKRNIAETERIITENVVAVGCTSEGQATRYGKWKLWTAANQHEMVTFSTGINGSFITPGDVVNIQDSDRYAIRYGGRISSTGTLSTTVIPLDSAVTLASGSSYILDVVIVQPAAFVTQASSAVIGGVTYNTGDLVPSVTTEAASYNTKDDSGNPVSLSWNDHFRTESRTVSTSAGSDITSLTVSSAYSEAPGREDMWVLTETKDSLDVNGSAKQYKVLAIAQGSKNTYDITAVEHYNDKYSAIEKDFTTYVPEALAQVIKPTDTVPPVIDAWVSMEPTEEGGEELVINWTPPTDSTVTVPGEDGNDITIGGDYEYEFGHGFEIVHDIPTISSPYRVPKQLNCIRIPRVPGGKYNIGVRTVNVLENKSAPKFAEVEIVEEKFQDNIPRYPLGVPVGGSSSVHTSMSSSGVFSFGNSTYDFTPPQSGGAPFTNTSTTAADYQQDASNLPTITWTSQTNSGEFIDEHHYILFQPDLTSNPMRLMKFNKEPSHGVAYWFDAGTGSETTGTTALTGTVTTTATSSAVTGSGTSFTTELTVGCLFVVGTVAARVSFIESDTKVYLDRPFEETNSGASASTNNYHIDYLNDTIIARVYRTSAGYFSRSLVSLLDIRRVEGDFTYEEATESNISASDATAYAGTLTNAAAQSAAAAVINQSGSINTGDKVTVTDISADVSASRVYIGPTQTASSGVAAEDFSSVVVRQFDGSVIIDGTLDATKIVANSIGAGQIAADSITANKLSGDVTETYPFLIGNNTFISMSTTETFTDTFAIPAPELGIAKRQRINAIVEVTLLNTDTSNDKVISASVALYKKGKGSLSSVEVGTVTMTSTAEGYISGNKLNILDITGGVAKASDATGGKIGLAQLYYDSANNRTHFTTGSGSFAFGTGDTLHYSADNFLNTTNFFAVESRSAVVAGLANPNHATRVHLPFDITVSSSTTATEFRFGHQITGVNASNTQATIQTITGTLQNIA